MGSWRLASLPLLQAFFIAVGFFSAYGIAVSKDHVTPLFPYISDAGARPPESCVFTLCLTLGAAASAAIGWARCAILDDRLDRLGNPLATARTRRWNYRARIFGYIAAFGLIVVASFQSVNEGTVHGIGAFLTFAGGLVFFIIQSWLSWRTAENHWFLRVILSLMATGSLGCAVIAGGIAIFSFPTSAEKIAQCNSSGTWVPPEKTGEWQPCYKGYNHHLASTFCEWITGLIFILYFMSFIKGFHKYSPIVGVRELDASLSGR